MLRPHHCAVAVIALTVSLATGAWGDQPQTGTIEGQVVDAAGNGLPGVTVTLRGERADAFASSDAEGRYRFGLLAPGAYSLRAELEGFAPAESPQLQLGSGERKSQQLRLGLATEETIAVVAEAPLIDKFEVAASASVQGDVAEELAFAHRHYQSVITMLPGVVQDAESQDLEDNRPAMNGGLWQEAAAFVDGVDTSNSRRGGSSRLFLPTTALAEVRADASAYGAEYGRVTGGVTGIVTKSGTNQFHGDFLYIGQNPKWTAANEHVEIDRQDDMENGFELALGGPLVRDRAWFFAAGSRNSTNRPAVLVSGEAIDSSAKLESAIAKINFQPGQRHQFAATWIDAPAERPFFAAIYAEPASVSLHDLGGDLVTANWNWSAASDKFLEVRASSQDSSEGRTCCIEVPPVDPNASPDDPAGNMGAYWDLNNALRYHSAALPLGPGELDFPREQGNVAFTWFAGRSELKLGADYQEVKWTTDNRPPDRYQGRGYDPSRPGGFQSPVRKLVFVRLDTPVETRSRNTALFVQDRISIGDHWTFTGGLRWEDQEHENDVGAVLIDSADLAPRLAAIYDVGANGTLLVKATAGRYYAHIPQNVVNQDGSTLPNGANAFTQYGWNAATQRYDNIQRVVTPTSNTVFNDIDPYYKDELTAGIEVQLGRNWALDARAIWWELDDLYSASSQVSADGSTVVRMVRNVPQGKREYRGLQLELNRAFRNGWVVRTNYTLAESEGNMFGNTHFTSDDDDFLEFESVLTDDCVSCAAIATALGTPPLPSGVPLTSANRFGNGDLDSNHVVNISGLRTWRIGKQQVGLGGYIHYRSGFPWGLRPNVTLGPADGVPVANQATSVYFEPRDAHRLPDIYTLNLQGHWTFPIAWQVQGTLRVEAANLTDQQEVIGINKATGNVDLNTLNFQKPREYRLVAGVRF